MTAPVRSPWLAFVVGAILLLAAVAGAVALAGVWDRVLGFEMRGQRSEGFMLTAPILSAVGGTLLLVRGFRRSRGGRAPAAGESSVARGGGVMLVVLGALAIVALGVLAVVARPADATGLALLIQFGALLTAGGLAALVGGIRVLRAAPEATAPQPR